MEYLSDILADFHDRLDDISKIDGVNQDLIGIYSKNLATIKSEVRQTGKFGGLLQKIDRYSNTMIEISRLPEMSAKLEILREQSIVLMVSAFEVFVEDIFRAVANYNPDFFIWPDKDRKIAIDIDDFRANFTLGDAIISHLENKKYSFQDLGSVIEAVRDYMGVSIEVETNTRKNIVLGTSYRHLIVHKNSKVDRQFLNQIRDVPGMHYNENDRLSLQDSEVANLNSSLHDFSEYLIQTLTQRNAIEESN